MPYEGEFAQYRSIRRIAESKPVKDLLTRCEIRTPEKDEIKEEIPLCEEAKPSKWLPKWVIAVDGSKQEVPVQNGFPGAEVSYLTVAGVMLNVEKMRELDTGRPVDPVAFRKLEQASSIDRVFPGCNVVIKGEVSAQASLRKALLETLESERMTEDGESLLDTYEALLQYKAHGERQECPYEDCQKTDRQYCRGSGHYACDCGLSRPLYSTDALRIHEGMIPYGTNGALFAEIMQVLERLWIIHVLRTIVKKNWLSSVRRLAFVIDGPLAVFGHPAWLSESIHQELVRVNKLARKINGEDILLLGIEKGGIFAAHLDALDREADGTPNRLPLQTVVLLKDSYIKRNIQFSESDRPYGSQTYFGRKFFYKTNSGALIVGTGPYFEASHKDLSKAEPSQFPRLADALSLLDQMASSRYRNAVIPLISAHAEAAIPMNLGRRILEQLARELVGTST